MQHIHQTQREETFLPENRKEANQNMRKTKTKITIFIEQLLSISYLKQNLETELAMNTFEILNHG